MNTKSHDVAIIGGGLIGLLSAIQLRRAGMSVVVAERNECGRESSWAGGGILSPLYPWRYNEAVNRLAHWSQQHYQSFCEDLFEQSGVDPEWTQSGILILDQGEFDNGLRWASDYPTATVQGIASELEPVLGSSECPGLLFPEMAQVRNPRLLTALKKTVLMEGVEVLEHTAITGFKSDNGCISALLWDGGEIHADQFVVAGGAWSAAILTELEVRVEIKPTKGQMVLFKGPPGYLSHIVMEQGRYLIPRRDGHILVGSTLEDAGFDKTPTEEAKISLIEDAYRLCPGLRQQEIIGQWAGLRPASPDGVPYICRHPQFHNLFLNSGHFRNGVVLGLASATLLKGMICQEEPILDFRAYNLFEK